MRGYENPCQKMMSVVVYIFVWGHFYVWKDVSVRFSWNYWIRHWSHPQVIKNWLYSWMKCYKWEKGYVTDNIAKLWVLNEDFLGVQLLAFDCATWFPVEPLAPDFVGMTWKWPRLRAWNCSWSVWCRRSTWCRRKRCKSSRGQPRHTTCKSKLF